jgi:choline/glycine/proline betaine transport protein
MNDWKKNLGAFFEQAGKAGQREPRDELETFVAKTVIPAFEEVAAEMRKHQRQATLRGSGTSAALIIQRGGEEEMTYRVQGRMFPNGILPFAEIRFRERKGLKFITVESMFRSGAQDYRLADVTKDEIIRDFVQNYTMRVRAE